MLSAAVLLLPLAVCLAAPSATEDQLRSLIQPIPQSPTVPDNSQSLFASLAARSPIDTFALDTSQTSNVATNMDTQISPANQQLAQLSLAGGITNLIKAVLQSRKPSTETAPSRGDSAIGNPAGTGLPLPNNFHNNFPNSFPNTYPNTLPNNFPNTFPNTNTNSFPSNFPNSFPNNYPNTFPNGGITQHFPTTIPVQPKNNNNFNPLRFLMSGLGGGSRGPFGMMNMKMMMKMMEGLMELFF